MAQKNTATKSRILFVGGVCLIAVSPFSGCRKAENAAEAEKRSAEQVPKKYTQEEANREFQKQLKVPGARESSDAGRFLAQLLESGRLPGAENAEKGAMLSPASADTLLPNVYTPQPTNYPLSRTFNGQRKLGGPWENHYTVVKLSADSPWQIKRAWRTEAQGNTVEEYRVK